MAQCSSLRAPLSTFLSQFSGFLSSKFGTKLSASSHSLFPLFSVSRVHLVQVWHKALRFKGLSQGSDINFQGSSCPRLAKGSPLRASLSTLLSQFPGFPSSKFGTMLSDSSPSPFPLFSVSSVHLVHVWHQAFRFEGLSQGSDLSFLGSSRPRLAKGSPLRASLSTLLSQFPGFPSSKFGTKLSDSLCFQFPVFISSTFGTRLSASRASLRALISIS